MVLDQIFFEVGIVIIIAALFAFAAAMLRQPLILAYIIAGIVLGPVSGMITDAGLITKLSEIGIAFLLFLVGLEMDLRKLKSVSLVAGIAGLWQVSISVAAGFFLLLLLGFSRIEAVYLAIALAFSSTMVVVKLLSDKQELDTLHGRIITGILLVQDVIAIFALAIISNIGHYSPAIIADSLAKGVALFAVAFLSGRFALPIVFRTIAKSQELLFLTSIMWCFAMAMFAGFLGYSIAIGAFLAGLSLASLSYSLEISSRVKSLKDFFAIIFFVSLGMQTAILQSGMMLKTVIVLSAFVIIANPLAVMIIMSVIGYNKKVSFLSSIGLSQVSEFSLILIALGATLGHLTGNTVYLISIIAIITITLASYTIHYSGRICSFMSGFLGLFEKISIRKHEIEHVPPKFKPAVILCGQNRIGYSIFNKLRLIGKKFLVVDYNPDVITELVREKVPCIYGDIEDAEIIDRLNLDSIELIISTVPEFRANSLLIRKLKEKNGHAVIIVTASQIEDALGLYQQGADYVIMPHLLGGDHASLLIDKFSDLSSLIRIRLHHISELNKRKSDFDNKKF